MFEKPIPLGGDGREHFQRLVRVVFEIAVAVSLVEASVRMWRGLPQDWQSWYTSLLFGILLLLNQFGAIPSTRSVAYRVAMIGSWIVAFVLLQFWDAAGGRVLAIAILGVSCSIDVRIGIAQRRQLPRLR